jgi:non-ribosomal peptide synthetase component E (peptide arylation enzyme)
MSASTMLSPEIHGAHVAGDHRPAKVTRKRKPVVAEASKETKKVSYYLSKQAVKRLAVAATMSDESSSALLEEIIAESPSLRRWVVSDRAKVADQATVEVSSD